MSNVTDNVTTILPVEKDSIDNYSSYHAAHYVYTYAAPFIIIFGVIGNVLSIIVLLRGRTKTTTTTTMYLVALSGTDLCALIAGLLQTWIDKAFGISTKKFTDIGCKISIWLQWSALYYSAWILVCLTMTRAISACCPFSAKQRCTPKTALIILIAFGLAFSVLNFHALVFREEVATTINNVTTVKMCVITQQWYRDFLKRDWPWVKLYVYTVCPFAFILVGNVCIIAKVLQSKKASKVRVGPKGEKKADETSKNGPSSMTAMLITLNVVYLICTTPIMAYKVAGAYLYPYKTLYLEAGMELFNAVSTMLMYTNHSINFLLYCLSGSTFREETKALLFCKRRRGETTDRSLFTRTENRITMRVQTSNTPGM